MNKRIRELAEQALFETEFDDSQNIQESMARFAELIAIDVCDVLATYRGKIIFQDGVEYNCDHPIVAIQKHFGLYNLVTD